MKRISFILLALSIAFCAGCSNEKTTKKDVAEKPLYYIENQTYGYFVYENHTELKKFFGSDKVDVDIPDKLYDSKAKKDKPLTVIGKAAFNENSGTKNLTIPDTVTEIRSGAFHNCYGLEKVKFGKGITKIGNSAFSGCSGLMEVTLPDSVTFIGDYAFNKCPSMKKIELGGGLTEIGEAAFSGCSGLSEVKGGKSLTVVNTNAFNGTPWYNSLTEDFSKIGNVLLKYSGSGTDIQIPDGIVSISNAFQGNTSITKISLPDSVQYISDDAFNGCTSLKNIDLPAKIKHIGNQAFVGTHVFDTLTYDAEGFCIVGDGVLLKYNGNGTSIKIPDSVKYISDAFRENKTLIDVAMGNKTETIGKDAFFRCSALKTVIITDSVKRIDDLAFDDCAITEFNAGTNAYAAAWATDYGIANVVTQ